LPAQNNQVTAVDLDAERVAHINAGLRPIEDADLQRCPRDKALHLTGTTDAANVYTRADFVVLTTPTNYDSVGNYFVWSCV
tara:strand:- start:11688 stop:11930 length:243 start_codon:yes stop_codon:yes gene_type:complete